MVRLWGVDSSQLPERSATSEELTPLLMSILLEAAPFISDVPSDKQSPFDSTWKTKGRRQFPHSESIVYLYERTVPAEALQAVEQESQLLHLKNVKVQPETWYLRRSVHENAAKEGTASWDEWVRSFKEEHAQTEKQFTPTVLDTKVHQEWDCSGVEVELDGETWGQWTLKVEESTHKMPIPLKNRVFPVLQATTAAQSGKEFMVIQMAAKGLDNVGQGQSVVEGQYTSIERLKQTQEGIEWIMGTTSDAKGILPPWVQRMATPGMVAKDVEMFLSWIAKHRKRDKNGTMKNGQQQNGN